MWSTVVCIENTGVGIEDLWVVLIRETLENGEICISGVSSTLELMLAVEIFFCKLAKFVKAWKILSYKTGRSVQISIFIYFGNMNKACKNKSLFLLFLLNLIH